MASTSSTATFTILNAEEEPELPNYPPAADSPLSAAGSPLPGALRPPRRLLGHEVDDPTDYPRWGRVGQQRSEDTGPLTGSSRQRLHRPGCHRPHDPIRADVHRVPGPLESGQLHHRPDPGQIRSRADFWPIARQLCPGWTRRDAQAPTGHGQGSHIPARPRRVRLPVCC
jgi:hypothetical protein